MTAALHDLSIGDAGRAFRDGRVTSEALTRHALDRIAAGDGRIHAFVTLTADKALAAAAQADSELAQGRDRGPLHGIPYALKDLIDTAGIRTTCQSKILLDRVPDEDATVAARLTEVGAVLLGKVATYEFAVIGPSFDLPFPAARNPRNVDHITGGSSSGSAAAVAAGFARFAIGTDTGGSIRSPACYCGVVGLKPTYGSVSRKGVFPLSFSLDHVGPLAANVEDAALVFDAIAGHDPSDPASAEAKAPRAAAEIGRDVRGLRLAYARNFHRGEADPAVARALDDAAQTLARLGATVEEIDLPDYRLFEACGAVILQAEAYAVHERWLRQRPSDYGRLAFQSLASGAVLSAGEYVQAQRVRRILCDDVDRTVFQAFDGLICANVLAPAPRFTEFDGRTPRWTAMRTLPFNVTGHPVLAVPIGTAANGLPLGMQIVGRPFGEAMICRIGAAFEAMLAAGRSKRTERLRASA